MTLALVGIGLTIAVIQIHKLEHKLERLAGKVAELERQSNL